MAKTSGDFEKEFIETAKKATGKSLEEWVSVLKKTRFAKQKETVEWLKKEQKLNHLQATLLAGIFLNNGKPVYINETSLLDNQFAKCSDVRPLFDMVSKKILDAFPEAELIAKKTYISFTAKREFAAVNVKPGEIRLGMDLGDHPFDMVVTKTKLTGPMPRISHMVSLRSADEFDKVLLGLLEKSYNRTHQK